MFVYSLGVKPAPLQLRPFIRRDMYDLSLHSLCCLRISAACKYTEPVWWEEEGVHVLEGVCVCVCAPGEG